MKALGGFFCVASTVPTTFHSSRAHASHCSRNVIRGLDAFPCQFMKIYAPTWVLVKHYRDVVCLHLDGLLKAAVLPCWQNEPNASEHQLERKEASNIQPSELSIQYIFQDVLAQTTGKNTPSLLCCMPGAMNWALGQSWVFPFPLRTSTTPMPTCQVLQAEDFQWGASQSFPKDSLPTALSNSGYF